MKIVWTIAVVAIAWFVGIWGWSQIIGSIQHARMRGVKMTALTISIWVVILCGITAAVYFALNKYFVAFLIGLGVSLACILFAGEIK